MSLVDLLPTEIQNLLIDLLFKLAFFSIGIFMAKFILYLNDLFELDIPKSILRILRKIYFKVFYEEVKDQSRKDTGGQ